MGQPSELFIDTIGKKSHSNPYLPFIIELDSILGSIKFVELESSADNLIRGYEFGSYHSIKVKINGDSTKLIRVNIYKKDWKYASNQVCVFSDKFGVIAYYPTHRYDKYFLRKKTVNNLVAFELTDDEIDFIQYDSILNPFPLKPDRPVEIRDVED